MSNPHPPTILRVWGGPRCGESIDLTNRTEAEATGFSKGYTLTHATDGGVPVLWAVAPGYKPLTTDVVMGRIAE